MTQEALDLEIQKLERLVCSRIGSLTYPLFVSAETDELLDSFRVATITFTVDSVDEQLTKGKS